MDVIFAFVYIIIIEFEGMKAIENNERKMYL